MSLWHDMVDWVGGFPFEVARPDLIFRFYKKKNFVLFELKTCGGKHGCNEFVFTRPVSKMKNVRCVTRSTSSWCCPATCPASMPHWID